MAIALPERSGCVGHVSIWISNFIRPLSLQDSRTLVTWGRYKMEKGIRGSMSMPNLQQRSLNFGAGKRWELSSLVWATSAHP